MKTALSKNHETATVTATFIRARGRLRVTFSGQSGPDNGFTLSELDVLEAAIAHARRQMIQHEAKHSLSPSVGNPPEDDDMESGYRRQLRQLQPVPT